MRLLKSFIALFQKKYCVYVYSDTIYGREAPDKYNVDDNLSILRLPLSFVKKYVSQQGDYASFKDWEENYTCDGTDDLFDEVIKHHCWYKVY